MKVETWMSKDVITIGKEAGIRDALETMRLHSIRHLPVSDNGHIEGLITSGELKKAVLISQPEKIRLKDIMIRNPRTVSPQTTLEEAASLFYNESFGCLPVIEHDHIVGIITTSDILKAFIEIMGVLQGGYRIDVILKQVHGSFDEVIAQIERLGGYVISVGLSPNADQRVHHFRVSGGDKKAIANELIELGYQGVKVTD